MLQVSDGDFPEKAVWAQLAGWRTNREGAVRFLEQARAAGSGQTEYRFAHREPAFAGLRDYPPFQRFLEPRG
jgi:hypothetical protein